MLPLAEANRIYAEISKLSEGSSTRDYPIDYDHIFSTPGMNLGVSKNGAESTIAIQPKFLSRQTKKDISKSIELTNSGYLVFILHVTVLGVNLEVKKMSSRELKAEIEYNHKAGKYSSDFYTERTLLKFD